MIPFSSFAKGSTASLAGGEQTPGGNVEMVTVPALGAEWKADELRGMSKKAKREEKMENVASKWKRWNRGESGLCGRYFTRRFTAWFMFGLCAACVFRYEDPGGDVWAYTDACSIALVVAFTLPRVPSFSTNVVQPLSPAENPFNQSIPAEFSRAPANFSFPGLIKLQADTGSNFLPLSFKNIHGTVFDLKTAKQVAEGDTGHITVPAHGFPVINLNLNFTYNAINDSDATCQ